MRSRSIVEVALRCYPKWWRTRYGDEMRTVVADLRSDGRSRLTVTLNLLRGALRARIRATGMPMTRDLWSARTRNSIAAATLPWVVLAPVVDLALSGQSLHSSAGRISPPQLLLMGGANTIVTSRGFIAAPPLTTAGHVAWVADESIGVLLLVTLFVLFSGWTGLTAAIRHSHTPHRRRTWMLAWAPGFSLLADLALVIAEDIVRPHSFRTSGDGAMVAIGGHPVLAHALAATLGIVGVGGWVLSVVCVALAVRAADISPLDLRFGRTVSTVVAVLFALVLGAYVTWGVSLLVQARQTPHGSFTTIAFAHQNLWSPMVVVLLSAVTLSAISASAARRSWRIVSSCL
jgi:hypothetical protein